MQLEQGVRAGLERAGQSHLLRFWAELELEQRRALLETVARLGTEELAEHCRRAAEACARAHREERLDGRMQPVPPEFLGSACKTNRQLLAQWEDEGRSAPRACRGASGRRSSLPHLAIAGLQPAERPPPWEKVLSRQHRALRLVFACKPLLPPPTPAVCARTAWSLG